MHARIKFGVLLVAVALLIGANQVRASSACTVLTAQEAAALTGDALPEKRGKRHGALLLKSSAMYNTGVDALPSIP